jgi:hypothetical protein
MDPVQVRRWIAGFDAIAQADLEALRRRGPEPARAIALALSMIAAAEQVGFGVDAVGPRRDGEDEAVRAIWARLRERQCRGGP